MLARLWEISAIFVALLNDAQQHGTTTEVDRILAKVIEDRHFSLQIMVKKINHRRHISEAWYTSKFEKFVAETDRNRSWFESVCYWRRQIVHIRELEAEKIVDGFDELMQKKSVKYRLAELWDDQYFNNKLSAENETNLEKLVNSPKRFDVLTVGLWQL